MACKDCTYRTDKGNAETNKGPNCILEYTQNPSTKEAVRRVLKNGGEVCSTLRRTAK